MPEQSIISRFKAAGTAFKSRTSTPASELVKIIDSIFATTLNSETLPNPDKVLLWESGAEGYQLYKDMLYKDTIIGHIFESRINELLSTDWEVKPYVNTRTPNSHPTSQAEDQADVIKRIFNDREDSSLDRLMETSFQECLAVGFSVTEPIWAINKKTSTLEPMAFRLREQERFSFSTKWELQLKPSQFDYHSQPIKLEPWRFIVMRRAGGANNPYGNALCQRLYWLYFVKKKVMQFWAIYQERFGTPILKAKYKAGQESDEALQTAIEVILEKYGNAAGLQHSDAIEIELLEAKRASNSGYEGFIKYCDDAMTKAILGQTLTSGEGQNGTNALGNVHKKVADDILKRDAKFVKRVIGQQLIQVVTDLNFPKVEGYAQLIFDVEPPEDLVAKGEVYTTAINNGVEIGVDHYRKEFNIPPPSEGEDVLEPSSQMSGLMSPTNPLSIVGKNPKEADDKNASQKKFIEFDSYHPTNVSTNTNRRFYFLETARHSVSPDSLKPRNRIGKLRAIKGSMFMCDTETNYVKAVRFDSKLIQRAQAIDFMQVNFIDFAGKQPPIGVAVYKMSETFHLHDPFKEFILDLFASMEPELRNILESNAPVRAVVDQLVTKRMATDLNRRIPVVNKQAIEFGATVFAAQLSKEVNIDIFDRYVNEYLDIHAFQTTNNKLSPVTRSMLRDASNRVTAKSRDIVKKYKDGEIGIDEAVLRITAEFKGVSAYKANQIAVSEVNNAASFASFQIIKDTGMKFDAYFLVDPISCDICLEQAARNPYRVEQAEVLGLPHPNCNDFWAFVPTQNLL